MSKKDLKNDPFFCRRGKVGGEALIEGVMMRCGTRVNMAVRKENGDITSEHFEYVPLKKRHKFCNIPIIRGVINFVESMVLSFKVLSRSAEMLGIEEEETKFEKWLQKRFGKSIMAVIMPISIILGIALAIGLFVLAPAAIVRGIEAIFNVALEQWVKGIIEGVIKVALFISYLALVSLAPDIKRTFMYHGSEHKSIFCYEQGLELTVENVRKQKRFHPRCGTSFTFFMLGLGIIAGMVIPWEWANVTVPALNIMIRVLCKLLVLPIICGVGYEFLMYAGKHDNFLIRAISAPGLWLQRITTKEPDDSMIEVAIESLKGAMPDEFPEYADKPAEAVQAESSEETRTEPTEEKPEQA